MRLQFKVLLVLILGLFVMGCSSLTDKTDASSERRLSQHGISQQPVWWPVRFRKTWPEGERPPFYSDLLIADRIVRPVLQEYKNQIPLWRFHRRAARDAGGNTLTFWVHCDTKTAAAIFTQIKQNPLLQQMLSENVIEHFHTPPITSGRPSAIEATSDSHWPEAIQKTWPAFIMGASESWLALVQKAAIKRPVSNDASLAELLQNYRDVNEDVNKDWKQYGKHAYLHHLNALFGYAPLEVRF